jgi:hypothetical protein
MTPTLQDLVARELARRGAADANRYAPEGLILEGGPDDDAKLGDGGQVSWQAYRRPSDRRFAPEGGRAGAAGGRAGGAP